MTRVDGRIPAFLADNGVEKGEGGRGLFSFRLFPCAREEGEASRGSAIDRHVRVIHIGAIDAGLGSARAKDVYRYVGR